MPTAQHFGEDQIAEYKEAFALFDKSGKGNITADALGDCLRACGQNPTNAQFLTILKRPGGFDAVGSHEEFNSAFAVFDRDNNGFISAGELRYVLTSVGEKMTDADVDSLLKSVEVTKDGFINYQEFVRTVLSG